MKDWLGGILAWRQLYHFLILFIIFDNFRYLVFVALLLILFILSFNDTVWPFLSSLSISSYLEGVRHDGRLIIKESRNEFWCKILLCSRRKKLVLLEVVFKLDRSEFEIFEKLLFFGCNRRYSLGCFEKTHFIDVSAILSHSILDCVMIYPLWSLNTATLISFLWSACIKFSSPAFQDFKLRVLRMLFIFFEIELALLNGWIVDLLIHII